MKKTEFKIIKLNPKKAKEMLDINILQDQRPLSLRRLQMIENKIKDGLFRHAEIAVAVCGDKRILVNGQTCSTAIVRSGETVDAAYEEWIVDGAEDLSLLFRQFDNGVSMRKLQDMLRVEKSSNDIEVPDKIATLLISALSLNDARVMRMTADDKVGVLSSHIEECHFLNRIINGGDKQCKFLSRSPAAAAMLRTWNKCQKDAINFWSTVRDGEDLKKDDPEMLLRDLLISCKVNRGMGACSVKPVSNHEVIYRSINAWNAKRKNETRSTLKYNPGKEIPRAI